MQPSFFSKSNLFLFLFVITLFFIKGNFTLLNAQGLSLLQIPILYPENELESSLNLYYSNEGGIFCEDNSYTNFNNDHLKILCKQKEEIKITIDNGEVITQVPITIEADYLIEKQFFLNLGFYKKLFNFKFERDIDFDILVTFKTKVHLNDKLELIPNTTWSFDWQTYPSISFAFFSFRVTDVAMDAIARTLEDFANNRINKAILEEINISTIIDLVKETVNEPFILDPKRKIWSYIDLQNMRAGQISLSNQNIKFYFEVDFNAYLGFNFSDLVNKQIPSPVSTMFSNVTPIPVNDSTNSFDIDFTMRISPKKLETLIFDHLASQTVKISDGQRSLNINEIYIQRINRFVETDVYLKNNDPNNPIKNFRFFLKFIPYYDLEKKKIRVKDVSYTIKTDSKLINWGSSLLKNNIAKTLEENISFSIESFIKSIQASLNKELASFEINPQMQSEIFVETLEVTKVSSDQSHLIINFNAQGNTQLKLKNLF